jgi:hypothetical protein
MIIKEEIKTFSWAAVITEKLMVIQLVKNPSPCM